jgi:hypothetical protein
MAIDLLVNIAGGFALIAFGYVSRQLLFRFHTRATRRLWRGIAGGVLVAALTSRKGPHLSSGVRTSLSETRILVGLLPKLVGLRTEVRISESAMTRARGVTTSNLLIFGGSHVNELAAEALRLLQSVIQVHGEDRAARSFIAYGKTYSTIYSSDDAVVKKDYGLIVRTSNPFASDPDLSAIFVMGLHGLGTAGAAQVLIDEHLAKSVLRGNVDSCNFAAVVSVRAVGDDYAVAIEDVQSPIM